MEGKCPVTETSHAIKVAIDEALLAKENGEEKVILFNFSGHGHFDLVEFDLYLSGNIPDCVYKQ